MLEDVLGQGQCLVVVHCVLVGQPLVAAAGLNELEAHDVGLARRLRRDQVHQLQCLGSASVRLDVKEILIVEDVRSGTGQERIDPELPASVVWVLLLEVAEELRQCMLPDIPQRHQERYSLHVADGAASMPLDRDQFCRSMPAMLIFASWRTPDVDGGAWDKQL